MPKGQSTKYKPDSRPALARGLPVGLVDALLDILAVDEAELTMDATWSDLGGDALDLVEFTMVLEDAYAIAIDDELTESWGRAPLKTILDDLRHLGAKL